MTARKFIDHVLLNFTSEMLETLPLIFSDGEDSFEINEVWLAREDFHSSNSYVINGESIRVG